jgi:hypothetical protein
VLELGDNPRGDVREKGFTSNLGFSPSFGRHWCSLSSNAEEEEEEKAEGM